jgi:7-cyano-7-deazaguanine synthase
MTERTLYKDEKQLIMISGGLDSVVLAHKLKNDGVLLRGIYFDIGYLPAIPERNAAKMAADKLNIPLEIVDVQGIHNMVSGFIPIEDLGNGELDKGQPGAIEFSETNPYIVGFPVLMSMASYYALLAKIPVLNVAFIEEQAKYNPGVKPFLNNWINTIGPLNPNENLEIKAPFVNTSKAKIVELGASLSINFTNTWSCHRSGPYHCGVCGGCISRKEAFSNASISDPTKYIESKK